MKFASIFASLVLAAVVAQADQHAPAHTEQAPAAATEAAPGKKVAKAKKKVKATTKAEATADAPATEAAPAESAPAGH